MVRVNLKKVVTRSITVAVIIALLAIVSTGCRKAAIVWKGSIAGQEDNIVLTTGGPRQGFWKTNDVEISYDYGIKEGLFSITGEVNTAGYIRNNFSTYNNFSVSMNLLDDSKKIVDNKWIVITGLGVPVRPYFFKYQFQLPEGAVAMNFSYAGIAREGGGGNTVDAGDAITYGFWKNP